MREKDYELIEHTADIGIRVRGENIKILFTNAASALFDIVARAKPSLRIFPKKIRISVAAGSSDELLISWLNELLSLSTTKEVVFTKFIIHKLSDTALEAIATGYARKNFTFSTEIKAATYHGLKLEKTPFGWQAEVIFDV